MRATRWIVAVIAGVVIMAVAVALVPIFNATIYSPAKTAMDYLTAVANHDVKRALSLVDAPRPTVSEGLSDGILNGAPTLPSNPRVETVAQVAPDTFDVTLAYVQGTKPSQITLRVVHATPTLGVFNNWAVQIPQWPTIDITASGIPTGVINGVSVPAQSVPVIFPAEYLVGFNTTYLQSDLQRVTVTGPDDHQKVDLAGKPTQALTDKVSEILNAQLDKCATAKTLQPAGCGFGKDTNNQILGDVTWKVKSYPTVSLETGPGGLTMAASNAVFTVSGRDRDSVTAFESDFTDTITTRITATVNVVGDQVTVTQTES